MKTQRIKGKNPKFLAFSHPYLFLPYMKWFNRQMQCYYKKKYLGQIHKTFVLCIFCYKLLSPFWVHPCSMESFLCKGELLFPLYLYQRIVLSDSIVHWKSPCFAKDRIGAISANTMWLKFPNRLLALGSINIWAA